MWLWVRVRIGAELAVSLSNTSSPSTASTVAAWRWAIIFRNFQSSTCSLTIGVSKSSSRPTVTLLAYPAETLLFKIRRTT